MGDDGVMLPQRRSKRFAFTALIAVTSSAVVLSGGAAHAAETPAPSTSPVSTLTPTPSPTRTASITPTPTVTPSAPS